MIAIGVARLCQGEKCTAAHHWPQLPPSDLACQPPPRPPLDITLPSPSCRLRRSTTLDGPEFVDIPALSSKDYKLTVHSFTASNTQATVTFKNEATGEYTYYDLSFSAAAAPSRGTLSLECPVRTQTSTKVRHKGCNWRRGHAGKRMDSAGSTLGRWVDSMACSATPAKPSLCGNMRGGAETYNLPMVLRVCR